MNIRESYLKKKSIFPIYLLLAILLIIVISAILFPSFFYDQWIWKYYWGPIIADAQDAPAVYNGIVAYEGYTIVSEITYGILFIIVLYFIYRLLRKLHITVDWTFALSLIPFILYGPVIRVLEDSGYFKEPFIYWYISPLIYIQITFFAIIFLLLGYYLEKKYNKLGFTINKVIFFGGLLFLIPSLYLILLWIIGYQWGSSSGIRFDVFLIVIGIVSSIILTVYFLSFLIKNKPIKQAYQNKLNLSLLFGHLIDGITSYISIKDPFSMGLRYSEKHPASDFLLNIWGPLFPIVKFLLIFFVIYLIDIAYKNELKDHLTLVNLLKIGILILGFSPGVRDLLRVTMGV
jgi:uncharacterized membrane protein